MQLIQKAQAALKKDEKDEKEISTPPPPPTKQKKKNRSSGPGHDSIPDSFKVYRLGAQHTDSSHSSDSDNSLSTCYSHSLSEIASDDDEDEDDDDSDGSQATAEAGSGAEEKGSKGEDTKLDPLRLVWAKCRGYPWYPALIIDPQMPKGYVHKGVPLPSPPQEVLELSHNYTDPVYLVLFFDAKRTWQWLPRDKLEILGLDPARDEAKANEPRKPTDRKAVRKAYDNALSYQAQVNEEKKKKQQPRLR
nr:unnamed protein product [Callosobruchus chinensis]